MLGWYLAGLIGTLAVIFGGAGLICMFPVRWYTNTLERSIRDDIEGTTSRRNPKPIRSYFEKDFEKEMRSARVMQKIEAAYSERYEQLLQQKKDQHKVSNLLHKIETERQARKESIMELEMKG